MKKFCTIFVFLLCVATSLEAKSVKELHSFKATTLDGKIFDLEKQKGKIVLINFWAKWCTDCRKEMPVLNELYKKYNARGLEIVGANLDGKKHLAEVKKLSAVLSYQNTFFAEATTSLEEPPAIPTNYLFNKNGEMVAVLIPDEEDLELEDFSNAIEPLL